MFKSTLYKITDLVTRSDAELSVKSELRLRMENAMLNRINKDLSQENELLKEGIKGRRCCMYGIQVCINSFS